MASSPKSWRVIDIPNHRDRTGAVEYEPLWEAMKQAEGRAIELPNIPKVEDRRRIGMALQQRARRSGYKLRTRNISTSVQGDLIVWLERLEEKTP
jgi:hypothetical protein